MSEIEIGPDGGRRRRWSVMEKLYCYDIVLEALTAPKRCRHLNPGLTFQSHFRSVCRASTASDQGRDGEPCSCEHRPILHREVAIVMGCSLCLTASLRACARS